MTDDTDAVRRRTVLKRAAAGFGASLAVGAAATDEAAAAVCIEVTTASLTYTDACPLGTSAFSVSAGDTGVMYGGCAADDGTDYGVVDWDHRLSDTWIDQANVRFVSC